MPDASVLSFKSYAGLMSVYEALPHRPVVMHVAEDLPIGDACLAFFDSSSASPSISSPAFIEVLYSNQPYAHLTQHDFLSYLALAQASLSAQSEIDTDVLDLTVKEYLDSKSKPTTERLVLDMTSSDGEASMIEAMKILLSSPHQSHLPILSSSESKLHSIFGYVTLPQIVSALLVNGIGHHHLSLLDPTISVSIDQGTPPPLAISPSLTLSDASDLFI